MAKILILQRDEEKPGGHLRFVTESRIDGEFTGWNGDNRYRLINGQVWQQVYYKYRYRYLYSPKVRILTNGSRYILEVEGMDESIEVRGVSDMLYIYDSRGGAVGFVRGRFVYELHGNPIGQIHGTHVYKLAGPYVGELHRDMIVDKHMGSLGSVGHCGHPGNAGHAGNPGNRGAVNYGFPDVFQALKR